MLKQSESSGNHDNEQSHTSETANENTNKNKCSDSQKEAEEKKIDEKYVDYLNDHSFPRGSYTDVEIIKFNPG